MDEESGAAHAPTGAHGRGLHRGGTWLGAVLLGTIAAIGFPTDGHWLIRGIAAWDAALLPLVGVPWQAMLRSDAARTKLRARQEDPGKIGLLLASLAASGSGLTAAVFLLRRPAAYDAQHTNLVIVLGLIAVVGGWLLMQTSFTLHYARLYYDGDAKPGGLIFEGGPPDDLDFAYLSFGIGTTFQVADVVVSSKAIRRTILVHSILAFAFNTTILALTVSLLANS